MAINEFTKITFDKFSFWMEPGFVFVDGVRFNFKWLADGGIVVWEWNLDRDAALSIEFLNANHPTVVNLQHHLFEKTIFKNENEKE